MQIFFTEPIPFDGRLVVCKTCWAAIPVAFGFGTEHPIDPVAMHTRWHNAQPANVSVGEHDRLTALAGMVDDLDRNEHGRHIGDADSSDPSGTSQGNPIHPPGSTLGYDIGGRPYVMPERTTRDVADWRPTDV